MEVQKHPARPLKTAPVSLPSYTKVRSWFNAVLSHKTLVRDGGRNSWQMKMTDSKSVSQVRLLVTCTENWCTVCRQWCNVDRQIQLLYS